MRGVRALPAEQKQILGLHRPSPRLPPSSRLWRDYGARRRRDEGVGFWRVISLFITYLHFLAQLDHTFEKVPSHGGKQLDFLFFAEVAGVEGFA